MTAPLRHHCRNTHCRSKLKEPTDNQRRAFCCRGCHTIFHNSRCLVCERDISRDPVTGEARTVGRKRQFCGRTCKAEARQFPHLYGWGLRGYRVSPKVVAEADKTGLKSRLRGDRPGAFWPEGARPENPPLRAIIEVEVFAPHVWERRVSSDGAPIQVIPPPCLCAPRNERNNDNAHF